MTIMSNHADCHYIPVVAYGVCSADSNSMKSSNPHSGFYEAKTSRTLDINGGNPSCNQVGVMVLSEAERTEEPNGEEITYRVRRLTELECTRLQGYPDGWVDVPPINHNQLPFWRKVWNGWNEINGKKPKTDAQILKWMDSPTSSAAQYKALGNSIALPFWHWLFQRMAEHLPENATLGSLFDGIGGFPYCWEKIHGKGSAVWASEIEPFPIAVTMYRFGEEGDAEE